MPLISFHSGLVWQTRLGRRQKPVPGLWSTQFNCLSPGAVSMLVGTGGYGAGEMVFAIAPLANRDWGKVTIFGSA